MSSRFAEGSSYFRHVGSADATQSRKPHTPFRHCRPLLERRAPFSAEEMRVETGGISAESATSSVMFDMIPKEGEHFQGLNRRSFRDSRPAADSNLTDELRARGLTTSSRIDHLFDAAASLGGAIRKDRLWFFTPAA